MSLETSVYQPGKRVRVTQQMPLRDQAWTNAVEGVITRYQQAKTGSWFAHARHDRLWLDRLELQLDLISLLRGAPHVQRVLLRRPALLLETGPDGRGNWQLGEADPVLDAETPKPPSNDAGSSMPTVEDQSLASTAMQWSR